MPPQQPRLREQVVELEEELRRVMAAGVEREGLREEARERPVSLGHLEADFTSVEREREPEGELEPFDPELEAGERPVCAQRDRRVRSR